MRYHTQYKYELANWYSTTTKQLRKWLKAAPKLWDVLNYDGCHKLTPSQVRQIVEHLGEP